MDDFSKELVERWMKKNIFKVERDRFKEKKMITNSFSRANSFDFNLSTIYPYVLSDILNRYYKLKSYNVSYVTGINDISSSSFNFSKLNKIDNLSMYKDFKESLDLLGVGYEDDKFKVMSSSKFVYKLDKFFIDNYDKHIFYKKIQVFSPQAMDKNYNPFEVYEKDNHYYSIYNDEEVFKRDEFVISLDISQYENKIKEEISKLNISIAYKSEMKKALGLYNNLTVDFINPDLDLKLTVEMENPEYLAGVSLIVLNPLKMDVNPFVSEEEYDTVYKYMQNGYTDGVLSGVILKNPLTYEDIYVIISYNFNEAIHLVIPSVDENDMIFNDYFGFSYHNILENGILRESDFLDGLSLSDAHQKIVEAFIDEGMSNLVSHFRIKDIILSSNDKTGMPVPIYTDEDEISFNVIDSKFIPVLLNRHGKYIFNDEQDMEVPITLLPLTFNSFYLTAMLNLMMFNDDFYNEEEKLFKENVTKVIYKEEIISEILIPLIFSIVTDTEMPKIKYHIIQERYPDKDFIDDLNRLNVRFIHDALLKASPDAIRITSLRKNNLKFDEILNKIQKIDIFLSGIKQRYYGDFIEEDDGLDLELQKLSERLEKIIGLEDYYAYFEELRDFYFDYVEGVNISKDSAYKYLIMFSPIAPFLSQEIYEDIYGGSYFIVFEEWPYN